MRPSSRHPRLRLAAVALALGVSAVVPAEPGFARAGAASSADACRTSPSAYQRAVHAERSLVAHWRLGERRGAIACDSAGRSPGRYHGGIRLDQPGAIADDPDRGVALDARSGGVRVRPAPDSGASGLTIEAWIQPARTTGEQTVLARDGRYEIRLAGGRVLFTARGTRGAATVTSRQPVATSRFQHVVATYDGVRLGLHLDGVAATTRRLPGRLARHGGALRLGGVARARFAGGLDEVSLYATALGPATVRHHRRLGMTSPPAASGERSPGEPSSTGAPTRPAGEPTGLLDELTGRRGAPGDPVPAAPPSDAGRGTAAPVADAPAVSGSPFFARTSVWNAKLPDDAPVDARSRELVDELSRQGALHGRWINTTRFSVPIYRVPADQPTVAVDVVHHPGGVMYTSAAEAARLQADLNAVPVPEGALPAAPAATPPGYGDAHMVIWQPSTDTMWELFAVHRQEECWWSDEARAVPGWHAQWGAKLSNVSRHPGINVRPFGATATGLPLVGGLITRSEALAARDGRPGAIPHALAIGVSDTRADAHRWPANRHDGRHLADDALEQGMVLRLPADYDPGAIADPFVRELARAARDHGMVIRDTAGAGPVFYGEDPGPWGADWWLGPDGLPGGVGDVLSAPPDVLLSSGFPWSELEVVSAAFRP